jgi:hypothetical protein
MNRAEFVKDFLEFFIEIRKEEITSSVQDIATLYAIYKKELRAERINGNCNKSNGDPGKEPATERQKQYLMDLAYKKGLCITQTELDRMTREQASKTIDTLLEGV